MSLRRTATLTEAKLIANRENAQRSTGPQTEEGKHRASLNRLKHGAWATAGCYSPEAMRALGEDPQEFQTLHERLRQAEGPENPLCEQQVEDLARLYWRRKRLERTMSVVIARRMQEAEEEAGEEATEEERAVRAQEEALLLPLTPEGMELERQLEAVDRAIDRKTRLLLRLRDEAERRAREQSQRAEEAQKKQARPEPEAPVPVAMKNYIRSLEDYIRKVDQAMGFSSSYAKPEVRSQKVIENKSQISAVSGQRELERQIEEILGGK